MGLGLSSFVNVTKGVISMALTIMVGDTAVGAEMLRVVRLFVQLMSWRRKSKEPPGIEDKSQEAVDFRKVPDLWNTVVMFPQRGRIQAGVDNTTKVLGFVQEAQVSLQIVMFVASHPRFEAIIKEKYKEGLQVQLITNFDASPRGRLSGCVKHLMRMGVPVKAPTTTHHMHNKYIIIDGEAVLTGSLNWSKEGFEGNWENVVVTTNQKLVQPYVENFHELWGKFDNVSQLLELKKRNGNRSKP